MHSLNNTKNHNLGRIKNEKANKTYSGIALCRFNI